MRSLLRPAFLLILALPASAGGNHPLVLPPCPVGLSPEVHDAINAARQQYDTGDEKQRAEAVKAFGKITDPAADTYLMMITYEDPHPLVRLTGVQTLVLRENPKAPIMAARLATSSAPRKYLDAGSEIVRRSGSREAVELLVEAMKKGAAGFEKVEYAGPDPGATTWSLLVTRAICARSLGRIGTPRAVEELLKALRNWPEWELRAAAAQALGEAGDPSALPTLLKAAENEDLDVECEALIALGRFGGAEAIAVLERASKREVSERETHFEREYWRNETYVRVAKRALKLALAQRAAAPPAPVPPAGGNKAGGGGAAVGGTVAEDPARPPEGAKPGDEGARKAPPQIERDEAGEDLLYVCDTTLSMSDAKPEINRLVEERLLERDLSSDFRFGFVAFRDFGNQILVDALFFTRDIEKARDYMMHLGFSGANAGAGSAAEKALQVAVMLDWSNVPRKRLVLMTDTYPNDEEDLYFRGHFLHDDQDVVINALYHTHAATKKVILQNLAKLGGGHADLMRIDKAGGRPRDSAEVR